MAKAKKCPFNRGDVVADKITGEIYQVWNAPGEPDYDKHPYIDKEKGINVERSSQITWRLWEDFNLVSSGGARVSSVIDMSLSGASFLGGLASLGAMSSPSATRPPSSFFKVGDRVKGIELDGLKFSGIVYSIDSDDQISIKRDDGARGAGSDNQWRVRFSAGTWTYDLKKELEQNKKKPAKPLDTKALARLVLPESKKKDIVSVLKQQEHSSKIFEKWGLGETISYGKGMTMMFYGKPGTGKTFGAHCIAEAMGRELLVVNAGNIQTSEPGGANRNIEEAFKSATKEEKVLFLDECDGLITTRNDVGMILGSEINTLLTEIEKFEGVCILATNRIDTLDEALERRLALIVEFPPPDLYARQEIWAHMLPKQMPLAKDVTIESLAEAKLTGAQIKNVLLHAARLAASEDMKEIPLSTFHIAIKSVLNSEGLMGQRSRHQQGVAEDFRKGNAFSPNQ